MIYEDWVSKVDGSSSTSGMFNRIEVHDAVIVVSIFEDSFLLIVDNYRHGARTNLLELPGRFINQKVPVSYAARRELDRKIKK
jgi:hypothetical protein